MHGIAYLSGHYRTPPMQCMQWLAFAHLCDNRPMMTRKTTQQHAASRNWDFLFWCYFSWQQLPLQTMIQKELDPPANSQRPSVTWKQPCARIPSSWTTLLSTSAARPPCPWPRRRYGSCRQPRARASISECQLALASLRTGCFKSWPRGGQWSIPRAQVASRRCRYRKNSLCAFMVLVSQNTLRETVNQMQAQCTGLPADLLPSTGTEFAALMASPVHRCRSSASEADLTQGHGDCSSRQALMCIGSAWTSQRCGALQNSELSLLTPSRNFPEFSFWQNKRSMSTIPRNHVR